MYGKSSQQFVESKNMANMPARFVPEIFHASLELLHLDAESYSEKALEKSGRLRGGLPHRSGR